MGSLHCVLKCRRASQVRLYARVCDLFDMICQNMSFMVAARITVAYTSQSQACGINLDAESTVFSYQKLIFVREGGGGGYGVV